MKFFAELDSDNKVINIIQTEDSETTASCLEKQFQGPNGVKFVEASNQKNAAFRVRMAEVALKNLSKLKSRQERGTIQGSGDNR